MATLMATAIAVARSVAATAALHSGLVVTVIAALRLPRSRVPVPNTN